MRAIAVLSGVVAILATSSGRAERSPARADGVAAAPLARVLKPSGQAALRVGLERLEPALMGRILGGFEADESVREALADGLATLGVPGIESVYGGKLIFVQGAGLSAAGKDLVDWIARARLHAIDGLSPPSALSELTAAQATPPKPPPGAVEKAWNAAGLAGAADARARFEAAARALATELEHAPSAAGPLRTRVAAEVGLVAALARLLAELPAKPRAEAVLAHPEHGYYLSPDVTWKNAPPARVDAAVLGQALDAARAGRLAEHLAALLPTHPQYRALVQAAERYTALCAAGQWPPVPVPKDAKAAHEPENVSALQGRLVREGYLQGTPSGLWDEVTAAAVLEVRRVRHLKDKKPDFDKDLVRVLAVPCAERLATILLNVKRWRHSAWQGQTESVQVNLAGQQLRYYRDGALVMSQRTVVGSDKSYYSKFLGRRHWRNATPILNDMIATVIVNPEWNVPGRIAREELAPEIEKDPTYIERNRFKTRVGGDGATYYIQESGPGNALGRIKVLFPNSESVYLHDTPGRAAFNLPVRALSHGCVRVQNAVDFGAELVRADMEKRGVPFDVDTIKAIVAGSHRMRVFDLANTIPVFLEYYTASVDESGALWFHPDIYGYDAELFHPEAVFAP